MPNSFRNKKSGAVVTFPDEPTTRTDLPGRDQQWQNMLMRYRRSTRWESISDAEAQSHTPERIPPAYLDPGDGSEPYPIPPAHAVTLDERGRPRSPREVHPGYQAGPIHDPNPHAQGYDDQLGAHSRTHAAFDDQTTLRRGEQPDVHGRRPDGTDVAAMERQQADQVARAVAGQGAVQPDPQRPTADTAQAEVSQQTGGAGLPHPTRDNKDAWLRAADRVGMDRSESEELNKPDLVAEVKRRAGRA
jgi:hypothetical protein